MEVSLRKAAALSTALLEASRKITLTPSVDVSIYDEAVFKSIEAGAEALAKNLATVGELQVAAFAIRTEIGMRNATEGVGLLLTEKALLDASEKTLSALASSATRAPTATVAQTISALRERLKAHAYGAESVSASVVEENLQSSIKERLQAIRRRKVAIADRLLEINTTAKVKLPKSVVNALKSQALID